MFVVCTAPPFSLPPGNAGSLFGGRLVCGDDGRHPLSLRYRKEVSVLLVNHPKSDPAESAGSRQAGSHVRVSCCVLCSDQETVTWQPKQMAVTVVSVHTSSRDFVNDENISADSRHFERGNQVICLGTFFA